MKRYFIDTEFSEDGRTIELISIALVSESGKEYYAVSSDFDTDQVNDWVKSNVLPHLPPKSEWKPKSVIVQEIKEFIGEDNPIFYGYYADYDWVVFCQLFGAMINLPDGYPMYCRDLQQTVDELGRPRLPDQKETEHDALHDARWNRRVWLYLDSLKSLTSEL